VKKSTKAAQLDELGQLLLTKKLNEKGSIGKKIMTIKKST
jgi:hypothetical protein